MAKRLPKPLALTRVEGNIVYTASEVWAWYVVPPQRWNFRPDGDRIALYDSMSARLAQLSGREIHLRVTNQPYPADVWARGLDFDTPRPVDSVAWRNYLVGAQVRLQAAVTDEKRIYLGVKLGQRGLKVGKSVGEREAKATAKEQKLVAGIVEGQGLEAVPALTSEVEWLLHRSVGLCLEPTTQMSPVTDQPWEATDLFQIVDNVDLDPRPFGSTTRVSRVTGNQHVEQEVAVLTLGRIGPRYGFDDAVTPWLSLPDTLPFPVEISVRMQLLTGAQTQGKIGKKLMGIRDQQKSYRQVGLDEPNALEQQAAQAKDIQDEMARGLPVMSTRAYGHVRFAVPGNDVEQTMDNARLLREQYATLQMDLVHASGTWSGAQQIDLMREFIPGEKVAQTAVGVLKQAAYTRRVPVRYIAAGVPQIAARLGDGRGPYIGHTVGGARRAVHFDPHFSTEELRATGLVPIVGTLGAGKSVLKGSLVYSNVLRGTSCVSFDPSGPFARLAALPELAPVSRAINLLHDEPGTLNPFSVVGEPSPASFIGRPEALAAAREEARRHRRSLALNILTMLLPPQLAERASTRPLLAEALQETEGRASTDLHVPLFRLAQMGKTDSEARQLAVTLNEAAEMPMADLFFNTGGPTSASLDHYKFLVLTMPGLMLPSRGTPRSEWSVEEQMAIPLLHLAAWYTSRLIYSRPMTERKMATFDEGHFLGEWAAGRTLFNRLGRDNRKWNLSVLFASQSPKDILGMDVANFTGAAFIGRIEDPETQRDALRLLRIQPGIGYEQTLGSLSSRGSSHISYREFIMRDAAGNVDRMRVDLDHIPHVLAALDTSSVPVRQESAA